MLQITIPKGKYNCMAALPFNWIMHSANIELHLLCSRRSYTIPICNYYHFLLKMSLTIKHISLNKLRKCWTLISVRFCWKYNAIKKQPKLCTISKRPNIAKQSHTLKTILNRLAKQIESERTNRKSGAKLSDSERISRSDAIRNYGWTWIS